MNTSKLVSFSQELEHVKTYLNIEILRFEDILNVEYDIRYTDFAISALSLQPLVENAVKYGIRGKEDGGTVTVCSYKKDGKIYVEAKDDGIGFNPEEIKKGQ